MKHLIRFCVICSILLITSCEKKADISTPLTYNEDGIVFSYPGNWEITADNSKNGVRFFMITSPGNAYVSIQIYPRQIDLPLKKYVKWFSKRIKKEMPVVKRIVVNIKDIKDKKNNLQTEGLIEKYSFKILSFNIPQIAEYYRLEKDNQVAFLLTNTQEAESDKVAPGFALIIKTFTIE